MYCTVIQKIFNESWPCSRQCKTQCINVLLLMLLPQKEQSLRSECLPPGRMLLSLFPSAFPQVGRLSRFPWWQGSSRSTSTSPTTCTYSLPGIDGRFHSLWQGFRRPALWSARWRRAGSFLHRRLVPARRGHCTRLHRHASGRKRHFLVFKHTDSDRKACTNS